MELENYIHKLRAFFLDGWALVSVLRMSIFNIKLEEDKNTIDTKIETQYKRLLHKKEALVLSIERIYEI